MKSPQSHSSKIITPIYASLLTASEDLAAMNGPNCPHLKSSHLSMNALNKDFDLVKNPHHKKILPTHLLQNQNLPIIHLYHPPY